MDRWLDSLSEDWPSQPPSQQNSSSMVQHDGSGQSNGSQSRIPRRTTSKIFSVDGQEQGERASVQGGNSLHAALKEKSSSSLNSSQKRRPNRRVKSQNSDLALRQKKPRSSSAASNPSMPADTVAFRASPTKAPYETPEWKRRIVQGKTGPGDQIDMFGPMGLQSVFKPPTIASRSRPLKKKPESGAKSLIGAVIPSSTPQCLAPVTPSQQDESIALSSRISVEKGTPEGDECEASIFIHAGKKDSAGDEKPAEFGTPNLPVFGQHSANQTSATSTSKPPSDPSINGQNGSWINQSNSIDFTPFYVSKSHTIDGKVDYAAIDMGMKRLHSHMENLRLTQRSKSCSQLGGNVSQATDAEMLEESFRKSQINEITNQSLPEDLSVGTEAFVANGGFVSLHRGGYSNEGSFQKRLLSSSSSKSLDGPSGNFTRASSQALPSPQHSQRKPVRPSTPPRTPKDDEEERPRSSGSPLKLFDKYDTFTNNRLARHVSRFEETLAQDGTPKRTTEYHLQTSSPSPGPKVLRKASKSNDFVESSPRRRFSGFGSGELDTHDFKDSDSRTAGPSLPYYLPNDQATQPLPGRRRSKKASCGSRRPSRKKKKNASITSDHEDIQSLVDGEKTLQSSQRTKEVSYTSHGKRLPYSPEKDVARKRQRTLCSSEERKRATLNAPPSQSQPIFKETPVTVASRRKRKDARYENERQVADPRTLAMRHILRPRNPTPNRSSTIARPRPSKSPEHPHITITGYGRTAGGRNANLGSPPNLDPPTQIVAGALATIALNTVQDIESGSRKGSVTISDFVNDAQQIMALIRAEKRPRSSHESAETSNMGHSIINEEPSITDSTKDDLTRPPSREGGSFQGMQVLTQQDPRVLSHLRKFEDKDELGLTLSLSGKSLKINSCDIALEARSLKSEDVERASHNECDPPNTRIRDREFDEPKHENPPSKLCRPDVKAESDNRNTNSQSSTGSSTGKSQPTGSSRGSANVKKIAPQSVAHLLSDQVADMFFDKERRVWIKRKVSTNSASLNGQDHPLSERTEEDLFGDIPDLSVDEMEELRRVKDVMSAGNTLSTQESMTSKHDNAVQSPTRKEETCPQEIKQDIRPRTADGKVIPLAEDSSAPSKFTNFAWSGPRPGTRATSYGDEIWPDKGGQQREAILTAVQDGPPSPEFEHEISILEGRVSHNSARANRFHRQPRVVTVAFSSPLIQSPHQPDEEWDRGDEARWDDSPSRDASQMQNSTRMPSSSGLSRSQRLAARRLSIAHPSFIARPMSRLDEQDEMSLVQYAAHRPKTTMDLAMVTPLQLSRSLITPPTMGQRSSVGFKLSPLPDFTVHQIDRPLETDRGAVVSHRRQEVSSTLSLTAQEIVKHLTDVEPYEPYWDHLPTVVLSDRGLTSLHMLDEFCGRIQELDVSRNRIRELDGVPSTVRSLIIRDNCLSELTAWHNLLHLQYLDVSGNQLQSLKGLRALLHLRSLKADDNEIEALYGIEHLDGLLSLSLRNNRLVVADFQGFNLKRLTKLDVHGNSLVHVANLHELASLETLKLSLNGIEHLQLDSSMPKLHTLDIANNCLTCVDLSPMPNLRKLILDKNAITQLKGVKSHTQLETLLWREQNVFNTLDNQYQDCHEIRNLYLSSTSLPMFHLGIPFLNLNKIELASMGLQSLPDKFGPMCTNLRSLNLNYNAIHDIRPLLGIARLQKLHLAGNRLSRLRRTAAVLDRLSRELTEVDLRNNNLTVGFYTPQASPSPSGKENRVIIHEIASSPSCGHEEREDYEVQSANLHLLPHLDKDVDDVSRTRLDEDTKLRRRVYEMLLVNACRSLRRLDGLPVERGVVGRKDEIWLRLVELGVLKEKAAVA